MVGELLPSSVVLPPSVDVLSGVIFSLRGLMLRLVFGFSKVICGTWTRDSGTGLNVWV